MASRDDGERASVELYWIPLGAGGHVVRLSGRLWERTGALIHGRRADDLYHSALVIHLDGSRFVIEQTPALAAPGDGRGVVVQGPVGVKVAGRFRLFRYEVRRWKEGTIPDLAYAVGAPIVVTGDPARASRILELVPSVPPLVWGRDERRTGDMWNSNSVISWLLGRAGIDVASIRPPARGRAPGWDAGIAVAGRARNSAGI
jgi:hypothetical protein